MPRQAPCGPFVDYLWTKPGAEWDEDGLPAIGSVSGHSALYPVRALSQFVAVLVDAHLDSPGPSRPAYSRALESIVIVTGPSLTSATCIMAPKRPRPTGRESSFSNASQKSS